MAVDPERLWFVATHAKPARPHPDARPGQFMAGLWEWDVAELFLADPVGGRYLELNLAPNGAWWSCEFTAPRQRAGNQEIAIPGVETFAEPNRTGGWLAAMSLPLEPLRERLGFGGETAANITFILNSPEQRFLSAAALPGDEPDFHQPDGFPTVRFNDHDAVPEEAESGPERKD